MVIGLFIDLWNWMYTRKRVQLMRNAAEIWQSHKLRLSILGVLYTVVEVDKSIPDALVDRALSQRLSIVDDALVAINLDGLMHFTAVKYGETETTRVILVKFVPNMPHWTWWYFLTSAVVVFIAIRLIMHFGLWARFIELIKPIMDAIY